MLGSAFHDGSRMSVADLLYSTMFAYRWGGGGGEGSHSEPVVAAATAVMRTQLVGLRALATDSSSKSIRFGDFEYTRELFVFETYTLTPPLDSEQDAIVAPPWSTLPWHLLVLMEEAVERGWAAFSQAEAARRGVEWLDLVPLAGHDQTAGGARGAVRARRIVARRLVKAPTRLGFPCAGDSVGGNVLAALAEHADQGALASTLALSDRAQRRFTIGQDVPGLFMVFRDRVVKRIALI
jgi:hypothetical protein